MPNPLRSVIIGCGPNTPGKGGSHSFAYCHGYAYQACPDTRLAAAASRNPRNVADFVAEFGGIHGYQDYREMLAKEHPDLVSVCAFPPDRETMVMAAMEAGAKGVIIEKPFALSMGVARRLMKVALERKIRLFVNHQRRYGKPFEWLRTAVVEKQIGELVAFDIAQPGGNLMNFGPHLVDAALFCLEQRRAERVLAAVDVSQVGDYQGVKTEAQLIATVHLSDGVRLTVEAGKQTCRKVPILRAQGTDGFAELHCDVPAGNRSIFRARYAGETSIANPATNEHFHHSEDGALYMKRAVVDVARAMRTGSAARIDAEEGLRGLEILMAIFESARLRRMVNLPLAQEEFPLDRLVAGK